MYPEISTYNKGLQDSIQIINDLITPIDKYIIQLCEYKNDEYKNDDYITEFNNCFIDKCDHKEIVSVAADLELELRKLESELKRLESELKRLESELNKSESELNELESELNELESELNKLESSKELEKLNQNKKKLSQELEKLSQKKHSKSQELEKLNQKKHSKSQELEKLNQNKRTLSQNIEKLNQHKKTLNQDIEKLKSKTKLESLELELKILELSQSPSTSELKRLKQAIELEKLNKLQIIKNNLNEFILDYNNINEYIQDIIINTNILVSIKDLKGGASFPNTNGRRSSIYSSQSERIKSEKIYLISIKIYQT
jgi:chromosome segregation ATPase